MKKIFNVYDKVANWLCSFESDKYVHLIVGLLISYITSVLVFKFICSNKLLSYAIVCGFTSTCLIGFLKEIMDLIRNKVFDVEDLLSTITGGLIGLLLILIAAL